MSSRTRWRSWLAVVVVFVAIVAGLGAFKVWQISEAIAFAESFPEPSETVAVVPARTTEWQRFDTAIGEVLPTRSVELKTEYGGTIVDVGFAPGARVTAGQVLLRLDIREEQASRAAAEAAADLARLTLERNQSLQSTNAVSKQATDTARAERDAALAEARRLDVIIDKKTLRAPFDARTSLHEWQPGQYVTAGTTVTWLVGAGDDVWVDFWLPQSVALNRVADAVSVAVDGLDGEVLDGTLLAQEPFVGRESRNVRFRALLKGVAGRVETGAIASVRVDVGAPSPAIAVPATAVRRDAFGPHVFVLNPAEAGAAAELRASRRAVEVLQVDGDTAYIGSGLEAGEEVAGDGAFKLRDGVLAARADVDEIAVSD